MTKFKPLIPLVTLTAMLGLSSQQALAFDLNPTVGVDGAFAFFDFEDGFGDPIYKEHNGMVNPYLGVNLWQNIGLELGYQWFPKRSQELSLGAGQNAFSGATVPIAAGNSIYVESEWELKAPYLGLTFSMPVPNCERIALFAMLGGAYADLEAEEIAVAINGVPLAPALREQTRRTFDDSKVVLTAKLGASIMVNDYLGVRAFGTWINTSKLHINSNQVSQTTGLPAQIKPNDTFLLGAGVFLTNFM